MAQSLGSLYIDLKANTATFVEGMSKASYAAKQLGRDIESSFSRLGSIAQSALAPFGAVANEIGGTLASIAQFTGAASKQFASMGKGMSVVAVGAGALVGTFTAVGVGAIALAVHATESAAKLDELSQSTGVSTEALSGLSFAAKQNGVAVEAMVTGLERMSKAAFNAATAPVGTISAFSRLGIAVKDSSGQMRDAQAIFLDVAEKFSKMPEVSTTKTALAIQLFGRSGAALIPILDEGREGLQKLLETAQRAGIVISGETAEAAERLQQSLGLLSAMAEGFANNLMVELLPTLQAVATWLTNLGQTARDVEGAVPSGGFWREAIAATAKGIIGLAQVTLQLLVYTGQVVDGLAAVATAGLWAQPAEQMVQLQKLMDSANASAKALYDSIDRANNLDVKRPQMVADILKFAGPTPDPRLAQFLKGLSGEQLKQIATDAMKAHKNVAEFATDLMKLKSLQINPSAKPLKSLSFVEKDTVAEMVQKLQAETSAELALASATNLSAAAMVMQKAAGEADIKIAETRTALLDKQRGLEEQLAVAKANQQGPEAAKINSEIAGVKKLLAELSVDVPLIKSLYMELAAAKEATRIGEEMSKEGLGFDREIASLQGLVAAYRQGGAAIAGAATEKQLEEDKQRVAELAELLTRVAATDPFNFPALAGLAASLSNANAMLDEHRLKLDQIRALNISAEIEKQTAAFRGQSGAVAALDAAYLQSAAAVRAAEVGMKVAQFKVENPGAGEEQIAAITQLYREQSVEAQRSAIAQETATYEVGRGYQDEIARLNQVREQLVGMGQSTLLVDAAIDQANDRNNKQWDEAAAKVGTLRERFAGFLDEIRQRGDNPLGKMFESLSHSLDDISSKLAEFVVTGRSSFKELGKSLEESLLKNAFENSMGTLAEAMQRHTSPNSASSGNVPGQPGHTSITSSVAAIFGIKSPEGKKPVGSRSDPIYVVGLDAVAAASTTTSSSTGSIFGSLGSLKSIVTPPFLPPSGESGGGGAGIFGSLLGLGSSIFGGFMADGGSVMPGKAYVVGENHPELFMPNQAGHIIPSLKMNENGNGSRGTTVHFHVHGVQDADSFRRSQTQIYAGLHAQLAAAHSRNG